MSHSEMLAIAARWGCRVADVERHILAALKRAGLVDDSCEQAPVGSAKPAMWYSIGVSNDDRLALLGPDDEVLCWIDGPGDPTPPLGQPSG
jgi:hypothetical protein